MLLVLEWNPGMHEGVGLFTLQERSEIFDLVHACIVSDDTIEALTSVLERASEFLAASFAATIHFGQALLSKERVCTGDPSAINFFESLLPTWLENEVPICVSAPLAASAERPTVALLAHGQRGLRGETTIFGFGSLQPHPHYSTILKLIVPHLHELLCRAAREKSKCAVAFTTAEREIIAHLISGKSN